ncbi:MAG: hypothetical protein P8I82_01705, partial [Flavobacteriales bacterium]|nr:hypothetical protein [Flavobacteriales bacterium]
MKRYLLYTFIFTLFGLPKQAFAQCDLPAKFEGNTGSNMTVMLTPDFISSLPITTPGTYLVALTEEDTLVVGSEVVASVSQTTIAIWGDDNQTSAVDGAVANAEILFQLVDGDKLYDVVMPTAVSFTSNGMSVQSSAATVSLNCAPGCTDSNADNYNAEATENDGSCTYTIPGCTDDTACNYDASATEDNGSCTYAVANKDCNGACLNDIDSDGVCDEAEIDGCTDVAACNFDAVATDDDG